MDRGEGHRENEDAGGYVVAEGERGALGNTDEVGQGRHRVTVPQGEQCTPHTDLGDIYQAVTAESGFNFRAARVPVPSGLCVGAWRRYLEEYDDKNLVEFLAYGWPIYCDPAAVLRPTPVNHPSALQYEADVKHYVETELGFAALGGPYASPPFRYMQLSPLMTKPKKDSDHRRVIMDLSWPPAASINDAIAGDKYVDGPMTIHLPTVEYMEGRLLELGPGAYLYKTDLARGYRQLRVDPSDWPLLGFTFEGQYYFDTCPPFGLRTSAMCMQRTSEAVSWIHKRHGFVSRPYLDDFGGAEATLQRADEALGSLQNIMADLGVREAKHKVCQPTQRMIWLGLWYDSVAMTISIPEAKLTEIMEILREWEKKSRASQREMQQLLGLLQFVASVSPPARVFTNRMLQNLREMPKKGTESLSWGFKQDLQFFLRLWPGYNGVKIVRKTQVTCQDRLELDACLTGCGAFTGLEYYAERFPRGVLDREHSIAHLEMLNVVVAVRVWGHKWRGHRVDIRSDNMNTCLAVDSGRTKDPFLQECVRELWVLGVKYDLELNIVHQPGKELVRADALSRMYSSTACRRWVERDGALRRARRIRVPDVAFDLVCNM